MEVQSEQVSRTYSTKEVEDLTGLHRTTIYRYEARGLITIRRNALGYRIFTDEDVARLRQITQEQVREGNRKRSLMQSERVAQLTVSSRTDRWQATRLRAELRRRAQDGELLTVEDKVRALFEHFPATKTDYWKLYMMFYQTFYGTTDLLKLQLLDAPLPETIRRERQRIVNGRVSDDDV